MPRNRFPHNFNNVPFRRGLFALSVACLLLVHAPQAMAAEETKAEDPQAEKCADTAKESIETTPEVVTTSHSIEIDGQVINYTAKAGKLVLRDREGKGTAEVFFIAYTKDGEDPSNRPVTFSFNGGPGSSSVWLHMGVLGPKRVLLDDDGFALPPPHQLVDNEYSLLDETDLVFIDPVSTGFSRPLDFEKEKEFHGLEEDIESVGEFIRLYVTEFSRWPSPKFLIGESYGTTRASALSLHLQNRYGMYFNGVMLVSSILDFSTARFNEGNDLPYILFLPSEAATAWYHRKLPAKLQKLSLDDFLREVEQFATSTYRDALFAGDSLPQEDLETVAARLADYTGLPQEDYLRERLRVRAYEFFDLLLKDQNKRVGRFDSRYVGGSTYTWERHEAGVDPSYSQVYGAYSGGFNDYLRSELNYESDLPYEILTSVVRPWNYGVEGEAQYVNVANRLREALVMNPFLQVHVCCGYYDLATPYFAAEYTVNRLMLDPELRDNITLSYYKGGHMMYTVREELARQKEALAGFIRSAPRAGRN